MLTEERLGSVIHIGYAKCASTFLQKLVFPEIQDYTILFRKEMTELWRSFLDDRQAKEKKSKLLGSPVILSAEDITAPTTSMNVSYYGEANDYDVFLSNLAKISDHRLKILVIIRRQDNLVQSWLKYKPYRYNSFKSFFLDLPTTDLGNKRIRMNYSKGVALARSFDFFHNIRRLEGLVSADNIHVLVYEDLVENPRVFFDSLGRIFGQSLEDQMSLAERKINETGLSKPIIGPFQEQLSRPFRKLLPSQVRKVGFRLLAQDNSVMSEGDRNTVLDLYRESNRRLSEWKNLNLGRYGYY